MLISKIKLNIMNYGDIFGRVSVIPYCLINDEIYYCLFVDSNSINTPPKNQPLIKAAEINASVSMIKDV